MEICPRALSLILQDDSHCTLQVGCCHELRVSSRHVYVEEDEVGGTCGTNGGEEERV
jgi:hypothetical protein